MRPRGSGVGQHLEDRLSCHRDQRRYTGRMRRGFAAEQTGSLPVVLAVAIALN